MKGRPAKPPHWMPIEQIRAASAAEAQLPVSARRRLGCLSHEQACTILYSWDVSLLIFEECGAFVFQVAMAL